MTQHLNGKSVKEFSRLWRAYYDAQRAAWRSLTHLMATRPGEDWANPLRDPKVQDSLWRWQVAVTGRTGESPFRHEANAYFVWEPSPIVARIRVIEAGHTVEESIFHDQMYKLPLNLIRYAVHQWKDLSDAEMQRTIEVLAGWVAANTKSQWRVDEFKANLDDQLPTQVVITLNDLYAPEIIKLDVSSRIEAARCRGLMTVLSVPRLQQWCDMFARTVVNQLVSAHAASKKGNRVDIDVSDLQDHIVDDFRSLEGRPLIVDDIQEFQHSEEIKQQLKACFDHFTPRERQIALLDAEGLSNAQIAEHLEITAQDVKNDLESLRNTAQNVKNGKIRRRRKSSG